MRRKPWIFATLLLLMLLPLLATRFGAVLLRHADGRALGYSSATQEWLALEYPNVPASIDGPYVAWRDGRREVLRLQRDADGAIRALRSALAGDEVDVELDAEPPRRFSVPLREAQRRAVLDVALPSRLLVASDFEGEFDAFTALMQAHGVLDADLHWRFGTGHVVLVGDLVDRGRNVLPLLWLVYRLEAEAQAAGGALHYVLGNHEQKLLNGRTGDAHGKYLGTLRLAGESAQSLWDERSELGRWLRSKPVLLKVGPYLFMHGGISPELLALRPSLAEVDAHAAAWFARPPDEVADPRALAALWDRTGVLWYRGLAMPLEGMPRADAAHLDAVLQHFGVRHLVIGHTLARAVGSDYDGRLLRVDVHHAGGTVEGLLIEGGEQLRIDARGGRHALRPALNLE
jgi:hypothetical protein